MLLDRSRTDIETDLSHGASVQFLCKKYGVTPPTMRAVLVEWGLRSGDKDPIKAANVAKRWNKSAGGSETK
jgi:hypothetical protein